MPEVIKVVFEADDSQLKGKFASLNNEVGAAGGAMAAWRKETGLTEQATIGATTGLTNMNRAVGKTAADFKPATEEMRRASVATDELTQSTGRMITAYMAYRVVAAAARVAGQVIAQSAERESAEVRFKNLAGNTEEATSAFEGLKKISKETGTNIVELADAETTLREAHLPTEQLTADMDVLAKKALVAKVPLQDIADLALKLATRGEVSGRQIALISKLAGDETGRLSEKYKEMTITIPRMLTELERFHKEQERVIADEEKSFTRKREDENAEYSHQEAMRSIATKVSGADTRAFREAGGLPPSIKDNRIKQFAKSYHISEADAEFYLAGQNASPALVAKAAAQQATGRNALSAQGVNVEGGMAMGEVGAGDLMSAGQSTTDYQRQQGQIAETRTRADAQLKVQRDFENQSYALHEKAYKDKIDISQQGLDALLQPTDRSQTQWMKEEETVAANLRHLDLMKIEAAQGGGTDLGNLGTGLGNIGKEYSAYPGAIIPKLPGLLTDFVDGVSDITNTVTGNLRGDYKNPVLDSIHRKQVQIYTPQEVAAGRGANSLHPAQKSMGDDILKALNILVKVFTGQ